MRFNKELYWAWLRPRIVAYKIKIFSVKYIYKKIKNEKLREIKKEFYHLLRMRNKQNRVVSVSDNKTVNRLVLVLHNGL
jgi:hypothetical protein